MDCVQPTHVRDPSDRAIAHPFLVCLTCGIVGVACDRCSRFSATPPLGYLPDDWCRACDCCSTCCTDVDRGLTPDDIVQAIKRAVHLVAESWIVQCIRARRHARTRSRSRDASVRAAAQVASASTSPAFATASTRDAASPSNSGIAKA